MLRIAFLMHAAGTDIVLSGRTGGGHGSRPDGLGAGWVERPKGDSIVKEEEPWPGLMGDVMAVPTPGFLAWARKWQARLGRSSGTLLATCDQGILSAGNLLTGIMVGRWLGAAAFGVLTLQFSILFVAVAVLDATLCTTIMTRRATLGDRALRELSGPFLWLSVAFAVACGFLAVVGLLSTGDVGGVLSPWLLVVMGLVFPAYLVRDFLRRFELAFSRAGSALVLDVLAIVIQTGMILGMWEAGWLTLTWALVAVAVGNGVALVAGLWRWRGSFGWTMKGAGRLIADVLWSSRWVLIGLFLFMIAGQMMPWLVTGRLGVAGAGLYAACAGLANSSNPLVTGFINALMPEAALHFAEGRTSSRGRRLRIETIAFSGLAAVILLSVAVFAGPLLGAVYGPAYRPVAWLLVVLAISFLLRALAAAPYVGLWALGRADWNATVNFGMVVVSGGIAWLTMPWLGILGAGVGVLAADAMGAGVRWSLFVRCIRAERMTL